MVANSLQIGRKKFKDEYFQSWVKPMKSSKAFYK